MTIKMSRGRGRAVAASLLLCLVVLHYEVAEAAVYTVGGAGGWSFNMARWPDSIRSFKAGDVLVFKYNPALHNVVRVNRRGYRNCITPARAKVYQTGNDKITLARGHNFFICNFPGHCEAQMKIAVTAT